MPASLPGINVADALARLGLEFGSLRRMLIRFADGQGKTLDALRTAVAEADPDAAAAHAHAIAGAAGNLGADALRAAAKALESAAREGHADLAELARTVDETALIVFRSVDSLREKPTPLPATDTPAAAADATTLRASLRDLMTALEMGDPSASQAALSGWNAGSGSKAFAAGMARVRELVEGYEYEEAATIVADLIQELEAAP